MEGEGERGKRRLGEREEGKEWKKEWKADRRGGAGRQSSIKSRCHAWCLAIPTSNRFSIFPIMGVAWSVAGSSGERGAILYNK